MLFICCHSLCLRMAGHKMNCLLLLGTLTSLLALASAFVDESDFSHITSIEEARQVDDGNIGFDSRIVDGLPAVLGQLPWQASLRLGRPDGLLSTCGGTLIHHQWVLTAAHCTAGMVRITVRLGMVNITTPGIILETTTWYDHPGYIRAVTGLNHDLSLLDLGRHVEYTANIQAIPIQSALDAARGFANRTLRASGFGLTNSSALGGVVSETLNYVDLRGITPAECSSVYGFRTVIYSVICARSWDGSSKSTCNGDSGGPLVHYDESGNPVLVGAVCFGSSQGCHLDFPTGFVGVGFYHSWLQSVTGINFDT